MPTSFDFSEWWNKETHKGTPVVVKMENPNNWSMLELSSPEDEFAVPTTDKDRGKNAKQLTWVILLKAHQAAGCVAWLAQGILTLLSAVKTRLILRQGVASNDDKLHRGKLYKFIRAFLAFAVFMLGFEVIAHTKGWHFNTSHLHLPGSSDVQGLLHSTYIAWMNVRANYLAPPLQSLANGCIILFLIQSLDRLTQCLGCVWVKIKRIKPIPKVDSFDSDDPEHPHAGYPMVLIQIPMCNEREVYQQSIGAITQMDWPRDRMLIQVLDDSDDTETQILIKNEVQKWHQKGINIVYRHRLLRTGYKAGNLKSAMSCDYVKDYEFVTIFDADFQPQPDFLKRTVIHFKV